MQTSGLVELNRFLFTSCARVCTHTHAHTDDPFMNAFVRNKKLNVFTLNICSTSCGDYCQTSFIWCVLKAFFSPFPPSSFFSLLSPSSPPPPPPHTHPLKYSVLVVSAGWQSHFLNTVHYFFPWFSLNVVLRSSLQVLHYGFKTAWVERGQAELSCCLLYVEAITYQPWKAHSW